MFPLPIHVPSTFLFAFDASRIIGRVSIRHELNEFLLRVGGHIGYVVVPEFRRQGHATAIVHQSLKIAHDELGIGRVPVACDGDNVGSIRTNREERRGFRECPYQSRSTETETDWIVAHRSEA